MGLHLSLAGLLLIASILQNGIGIGMTNAQIIVHTKKEVQPLAFPIELVPLMTTSTFLYSLSNLPSDVTSAQKICQINGGSLLSLQTAEELDSLKQNLPDLLQDDIIWTSAIRFTNDTENYLLWSDTSQPFEYPLKKTDNRPPISLFKRHPRNVEVRVEVIKEPTATTAKSKCKCDCPSTTPSTDPPTTNDPPTTTPTTDLPTTPAFTPPSPPIVCNRPTCTGHRPPCTELGSRTCIIKSPPVCSAHEKNCTVKCDGPCQILRQPKCKVVALPDCQLVTPDSVNCKTIKPPKCNITEPGACHSLKIDCHMDNDTPCKPVIKPCKNPCSKQDCQTVTPPCSTPKPAPPCLNETTCEPPTTPTCPPPITTCTRPFVDCSPEICQSNVIICPPRKLHCPPAQVICTEPKIVCDDPEVECPEPEVICGEPTIECEKPLVKCPDPVVNCDTIITSCERPAFFCSDPELDCPAIEKDCDNSTTCTPPPSFMSELITHAPGKCGHECCQDHQRPKRDVQQVGEEEDDDGKEKIECIAMMTGGEGWIAQNCNLEHKFICKMRN